MGDVDKEPGRFRRALTRLTADEMELDSKELKDGASSAGATHVSECSVGAPVCVAGSLRAVVLRPRAGVPTLEAELYDGTGTVTLIWLGRRRIRGIDPGRSLVVHGRLTRQDGRPTIYNPAYELRASSA
ncbi:MAG: nucleic acid binding OB-fold tRNA/helicase-type [Frankiales bacterium]|nr:nucleic acid binding OB-fold tRNA/helicase-type [Frankiales bacterium]